jgi:hypothetical protein
MIKSKVLAYVLKTVSSFVERKKSAPIFNASLSFEGLWERTVISAPKALPNLTPIWPNVDNDDGDNDDYDDV